MNARPRKAWALTLLALALTACGGADLASPCTDLQATCALPQAPNLDILPLGTTLVFHSALLGAPIEWRRVRDGAGDWRPGERLTLNEIGPFTLEARLQGSTQAPFTMSGEVRAALPGAVGADEGEAVAFNDARLTAWATRIVAQQKGANLGAAFAEAQNALGPADDSGAQVVSLGEGGSLTLGFAEPLTDHPGPDFAVFENAFDDGFLELAFVEVSSDGVVFVRFDSLSLGRERVASYATLDARALAGLAGKYRKGYGTPFDLARLQNKPDVRSGAVDLGAIRYVRLVDIIGDGRETDSFGAPIYDPTPTRDSAGFDLDAVGVLKP